uniref:Ovule protein n=1 Tax=Mesocestoides corti TaxID=53468 RepID=A0A5K3FXQ9_MESCO
MSNVEIERLRLRLRMPRLRYVKLGSKNPIRTICNISILDIMSDSLILLCSQTSYPRPFIDTNSHCSLGQNTQV